MKKILLILPIFALANYYNVGLYALLAKNYSKAEKYFKLSCEKEKNAWGCFSYYQLTKNTTYKNKACKLGLKPACQ